MAQPPDKHRLYQEAVQSPEADIEFFDEVFREHRGRAPLSLREDFCGTALFSRTWIESDPRRTALGVDLDRATLDWGRRENLDSESSDRVELVEADVRDVRTPRVDVACAMNFSFCTLHRRSELADYLEAIHEALGDDGMLVLELYGGTEALVPIEERRELDDFDYIWEQESYNPIDHTTRCHIHFELPNGRRLHRAFTYDWRLWTIPEIRELLDDVGFSESLVYWEEVDDEGDGTGEYARTECEENQEGWLVYVVGLR